MCFDRPEDRLRFLNNTIIRQKRRKEQMRYSLRYLRPLENTRLYEWILEGRFYSTIAEELFAVIDQLPAKRKPPLERIEVPLSARLFLFAKEARHAFYATALILAGVMLIAMYSAVSWSARNVNSYLSQKYNRTQRSTVVAQKTTSPDPTKAYASTPALPVYTPDKVWMVESDKTRGWERWSNGCQILTQYETDNYPRSYYTIPRGSASDGDQVRHDIVGIVYHTSESDIIPFVPQNNDGIQKRSQGLLEYIRNKKAYNYVIDRTGLIYRVVRDDHTAFHAGDSIWSDDQYTYVVLNHSFLGICFESTVKADTLEETLTEAQLISGRALTNVLRTKYDIEDANCTTHGLVSVSPDRMLIAFHHDWVRNFPFELMGLSDKYKIQPANMAQYGFTYDDEIMAKLGNRLWDGALAAEEEFKKRAEAQRIDPEVLRRKFRDIYLAQRDKARKLRPQQNETGNPTLAAQTPTESSSAESRNN